MRHKNNVIGPMKAEIERMLTEGIGRVHDAELLSMNLDRRTDSDAQLRILGFEVLIKCALKLCRVEYRNTHAYAKLWAGLPDQARKKILEHAKLRMPGHADFSNLPLVLTAYERIFVNARYGYEAYAGWSHEEVKDYGDYWVELGAPISEADFQYYPNELICLIEALEAFIQAGLSNIAL